MSDDERAIRDLVQTWMLASQAGDIKAVLGLMTDDVVFMVPGREPFGRETFAAAAETMKDARMEGTSEIKELRVLGEWAWLRSYIRVAMTPRAALASEASGQRGDLQGRAPDTRPNAGSSARASGETMRRAGYTLTILRKEGGKWLLARDANLLSKAD